MPLDQEPATMVTAVTALAAAVGALAVAVGALTAALRAGTAARRAQSAAVAAREQLAESTERVVQLLGAIAGYLGRAEDRARGGVTTGPSPVTFHPGRQGPDQDPSSGPGGPALDPGRQE